MTLRKAEQKTVISSNEYLDDRILALDLVPLQLTFHNAKANTLGDEYHTTYLHTAKEAFDE